MSKEQPPVREVVPYKPGKRPSTFRRLKVDFAGTALEQALAERDRAVSPAVESQSEQNNQEQIDQSPPLPTTPHHSPIVPLIKHQTNSVKPIIDKKFPDQNKSQSNQHFSGHHSPPLTTTHHQSPSAKPQGMIAPVRDFNRRANSIERDALPSGLFPGSTKKVYDALYLRTRGAVTPCKSVRASRRDLLEWTGIRNLKTIDNHIRYLMAKGLIIRHWELGSNEGSSYEVCLPEEMEDDQYPPVPTSGGESSPDTTSQKTGSGYTQKMGSGGEGQTIVNTDTSASPKTINTNTDDDTHIMRDFLTPILEAARGVVGGELVQNEKEGERWKELGNLLAEELTKAAQRAETISSVPAFFTAHLQRRLAAKLKPQLKEAAGPTIDEREEVQNSRELKSKRRSGVSSFSPDPFETPGGKSKFSLEECLRYAEHLHATGQGINNPGGFAVAIYRSGMADPLIDRFINVPEETKPLDTSACPDCHGSGFFYPEGTKQGVVKCKHERLTHGRNLQEGQDSHARLSPTEVDEQAGIIAELLESSYTIEQAEEQFAAALHPDDWLRISERLKRSEKE